MTRPVLLATVIACLLWRVAWALAQQPSIYYVYDALNRLTAVVDQQGHAATYTYDAVGNILKIDRVDAPAGPVAITLFTPLVGATGTTVQIFGRGFSGAAARNMVAFNGAAATVTASAANRLIVTVPSGATTGRISVTTPLGSATSAVVFRVLDVIAISPPGLTIPVGAAREFTATTGGMPTSSVRWFVNGVPGGEPATGTISGAGLYTAPATLPFPAVVTVAATHSDDTSIRASALVTIVPAQPLFLEARGVAVTVGAPVLVVDKSVMAAVSVGVVAGGGAAFGMAAPVSVRLAAIPQAFAAGRAVSVSLAPVITAVVPIDAPAGTMGLELTIIGSGFTDATAVSFHRNGVRDANMTATNLAVNAEGTEAIVEVSVAPDAAPGLRVVRVTTPVGISTAVSTNGNLFSIP
jgi:YD repeat-containing protein